MDKVQKQSVVSSLKQVLVDATTVIVVHYSGLSVKEITELRKSVLQTGSGFQVTKNSLMRLALSDTQFSGLSSSFVGPTAVAYSSDPVAIAKVVVDFAKNNEKLVILGGGLANQLIDANGIESLAKLPSLDELRSRIISIINTPASRIVGVLKAPGESVARVLNAYSEKK